jgi:hypothetical protein
MADIDLTVQKLAATGITPEYTGSLSTGNTYKVRNNGRIYVHAKKTGAGACTATIETPKTVGGLDIDDQEVTIAATTGDVMIGPFPPSIYNDSSGDVNITFSEVTDLVVGAFEL